MAHVQRRSLVTASTLLLVSCLAMTSGCMPNESTSQGAAELFVDRHYVRIEPAAAQAFCTGLALEKLKHIAMLTEGLRITEETKKPTVRYQIVESKEEGERGTYVFEGTIYVDGDDTFSRRWIVNTRRVGPVWKVSNFTEDNGS
jgi:hypothetical protein